MEKEISQMLLKRRIRNRIIEYLELMSKKENILTYQESVPIAQVSAEIFCQWKDIHDHSNPEWYSKPVFSEDEQRAILNFDALIRETSARYDIELPYIAEIIANENIQNMIWAAGLALNTFLERGKLDEENE